MTDTARSPWTRRHAYQAALADPAHGDWLPQHERRRNAFLDAVEREAAATGAAERERARVGPTPWRDS